MEEPLEYQILGESAQVIEITLAPGKTLIADGGALLYLDHEIQFETRDTDGAEELPRPADAMEASQDPLSEFQDWPEQEDDSEMAPEEDFDGFEEKDEQGNLLQKLWVATRKAVSKATQKPDKKGGLGEDEDIPMDVESMMEDSFGREDAEDLHNLGEEFSWYITHFSNESEFARKIALTTSNSGVVQEISLDGLSDQELIIQSGTFLCARKGVRLEKFLDTGISVSFAQEKLFKLDRVHGSGQVFLQAEGQLIEKELDNAAIRVNLFSLIAFESTLELELESVVKVQSMNYEDDTQFITLAGTGRYWVQTANVQQLIYRISPFVFGSEDSSSSEDGFPQDLGSMGPEGEGEQNFDFDLPPDD